MVLVVADSSIIDEAIFITITFGFSLLLRYARNFYALTAGISLQFI